VPAVRISEDLRPLTDLKKHPNEIVKLTEESGRPVILTRYGKGVAVLLSVSAYEDLEDAAARLRLLFALQEADRAVARGEVVEHEEVDRMLAEWEDDAG